MLKKIYDKDISGELLDFIKYYIKFPNVKEMNRIKKTLNTKVNKCISVLDDLDDFFYNETKNIETNFKVDVKRNQRYIISEFMKSLRKFKDL